LFGAASIQVVLFVWQLDLIRKSLIDAKKAAEAAEKSASAAKLNAQALIDAEAAQMYLVIEKSNVERMYQLGGMYSNSPTMHESDSDPPWIEYRLRNYGKSPAIVQTVLHGISLEEPKTEVEPREYGLGQEDLEIIGVGEQGQIIKCKIEKSFTFGNVRSIVTNDRLLLFYGHSTFMDHFGRKQTLDWELVADDSRWNLISHRNTRENPDS
jgi:hypothetical protein